eukprot:gb/GFBE01073336.1/.p1 GENE.gb/GFBE01073336.1/~~gb/GFBE01073336.1/.p1  ORF type:complete len:691 (+),score=150.36 gb/GFBE01073336.1/:1-2073(+)
MESGEDDGAVGAAAFRMTLQTDIESVRSRMGDALRQDFCGKLSAVSGSARQKLHSRLMASHRLDFQIHPVIDRLCAGDVTCSSLASDEDLAQFVDSGAAVEPMLELTGSLRRSFLSLQTAWEQLKDWLDSPSAAGATCDWELLTQLGVPGLPIEVQRRDSAKQSPWELQVTRACASPADTASVVAALRAKTSIVPPEGGAAMEDLLVLVDPDAPRATFLAVTSALIRDAYSSVVWCRELRPQNGLATCLALHAHTLFCAVQPPAQGVRKEDLEAHMRRQYLGRAYQCAACSFGPIDHFACADLAHHNGQRVGMTGVINNSCPRCGWFSRALSEWPKWDGTLPEEALLSCARPSQEAAGITAASAEVALRICYSARALWDTGQAGEASGLCGKLAAWETLTADDGVEHPVQLLLALATVDNLPSGVFGPVAMSQLLNEVCARRAEDEFRRVGTVVGRRRVGAFMGVSYFSAPKLDEDFDGQMPSNAAVLEACRADYAIDPEAFDFKSWVKGALMPWSHAISFVRRLRAAMESREGGWQQLSRDMEAGPGAYADVIQHLQAPASSRDSLAALLGVRRKEDAQGVLAAVAVQAFLHPSPQSRRTKDVGGVLDEPLGDVREEQTLRDLAVELRMLYYYDQLADAERRREEFWRRNCHVHSLQKRDFWDLWRVCHGENRRRFLRSANQGFVDAYG